MSVRVITTCYSVVWPEYALMLESMLQSIVDHPPSTEVAVTLCCSPEDAAVIQVSERFQGFVTCMHLDTPKLFPRCMGRHAAAIASTETAVWFADADLLFGDGCLDYISHNLPAGVPLARPMYLYQSKKHIDITGVVTIDKSMFQEKHRLRRAYGGYQIMSGDMAREHGYIPHDRWHQWQSADGRVVFSFRDDTAFRQFWKSKGYTEVCLDVPELYRIRHTPRRH